MKYSVTTESGSIYIIGDGFWMRLHATEKSGPLRTDSGIFHDFDGFKVGSRLNLYGPGLKIGTRLISTSPIVSIQELDSA